MTRQEKWYRGALILVAYVLPLFLLHGADSVTPLEALCWLVGLGCWWTLAEFGSGWLARILVLVAFASAFSEFNYFQITRAQLTTLEFIRLFQERGFAGSFLQFYPREVIISGVAAAVLAATAVMLSRKRKTKPWPAKRVAAVWSFGFILTMTSYVRAGGDSQGPQPWPVSLPSHVLAFAIDKWILHSAPNVPREKMTIESVNSGFRNIVLVIDESVRGDILDLNSPSGVPSGLDLKDNRITNFGIASSFANCSASSNQAFHFLVRQQRFVEDLQAHPPIWDFARKAGYKTAYIDAQTPNGKFRSDFTEVEQKEELAAFTATDAIAISARDTWASQKVLELLKAEGKHFIYVNKMGSHFPYEGKYPESAALYKPHLGAFDKKESESHDYGDGFGSEAFKNSYRNAVSWNLTSFFAPLLKENLTDTLIVYTSDHGQNLNVSPQGTRVTHCTYKNAPAIEGVVPMATITGDAVWSERLHRAAALHMGHATHFSIPPTLLIAMGYPPEQVPTDFAPSLFAEKLDPQTFSSGFFQSFGAHPIWRQICTQCEL